MSGLFSLLKSIIQSLSRSSSGSDTGASQPALSPESSGRTVSTRTLAWGLRVNGEFRNKVFDICQVIGTDPDWLMACMAFESRYTFSPSVKNPQSTATGLIQFMEATAKGLGTTTDKLAAMTAVGQLDYVETYFWPYRGRLKTLSDVYMAILYPKAIGQPEDYPLFRVPSNAYAVNKGLDGDRDGSVTKAEAAKAVQEALDRGRLPENLWREA